MGKYGFNKNELVKSVVDMVDKDGFHKEVVIYGKQGYTGIKTGLMDLFVDPDEMASDFAHPNLITVNVPDGAEIYALSSETDDSWALNIGDTLDDTSSFIDENTVIPGINAVRIVDSSYQDGTTVYYQIYAVDSEYKVLDRTKITVEVDLQ